MRRITLSALLALTACAPAPAVVTMRTAPDVTALDGLPAMKTFAARARPTPGRSNAAIAQDFLALTFRLESGRPLPVLSRFEGPITVGLRGPVPATAPSDLAHLLTRLRAEAGIDIASTSGPAAITIEFVPKARMRQAFPNVACFVVPRLSSWADYRANRTSAVVDWTSVITRTKAVIFVPSDTSPQEVRDCLHEELAQAIGPLNDLYSLSDSVFNDDNFHTVLTGFDMLVLRLTYAPQLHAGLHQAEVAALLPGLLAQMNPGGQHPGAAPDSTTPRAWITAVETALGGKVPLAARRQAAHNALAIARAQGWHDSRLAFSQFAVGRLNIGHNPQAALAAFIAAATLYRSLPEAQIHAAHVDMQLAAFALSQGDAAAALRLTDKAIPVVIGAENAALLATLLMLKSAALTTLGRTTEASAARTESLGWARYGLGSDAAVRARLNEIAAIPPPPGRG